ncbi:MAG: tyrosine--tRNA ligase [Alistipes indistinctus]
MNFVEELKWRGMLHDMMPGTEEQLAKEMTTAYVGIDPTADSLHIGHLVSIMILKHFQRCGHKPIFLVGGATGMIGDPSGKSLERNLLDEETLHRNQEGIKKQLSRLVDFSSEAPNAAEMVNNYDWMKNFTFLEFIRDIGKCITVNYMMAKDSVKKRFNGEGDGMSFTEFTYQLVQGTDFLHLYQHKNCKLQMGGSDQWGQHHHRYGVDPPQDRRRSVRPYLPVDQKADGTKFGKTESGNVWLDPRYTSPYKFYQFWLNVSDEDAERYIKIFTMLDKETIDSLIAAHREAPHLRELQKRLAKEITCMIHSRRSTTRPSKHRASSLETRPPTLCARSTSRLSSRFSRAFPNSKFPQRHSPKVSALSTSAPEQAAIFPSKGEARKPVQGGGVSLNKEKVTSTDAVVTSGDLLSGKYLLVQKGKKTTS